MFRILEFQKFFPIHPITTIGCRFSYWLWRTCIPPAKSCLIVAFFISPLSCVVQIRRSYLFETNLLEAVIHCLAYSMTIERDDQVAQLTAAVQHIIEACRSECGAWGLDRSDIERIATFLLPYMMKLLSEHKAKKYEETIFDFCTRSLVTCEKWGWFVSV